MKKAILISLSLALIVLMIYYANVNPPPEASTVDNASSGSAQSSGAVRDTAKQELRVAAKIWYRRAGDLAVTTGPMNSGDTIHFFRRGYSNSFRVFNLQSNRKDYKLVEVIIESYHRKKLLASTRPAIRPKHDRVEFVEEHVEMKEDFLKTSLIFQDTIENKQHRFVLFIALDRDSNGL